MANKNTVLYKPMTWKGKNYDIGENELPDSAAAYAKRRKFDQPAEKPKTETKPPAKK